MTTVGERRVGALAKRAGGRASPSPHAWPLVLPNAWEVASARLVVKAGFPVVATSSGAIAATLGYEDNDSMPVDETFGVIARIARSVAVPVTADVEAGSGLGRETWSRDSWTRDPSAATSRTPTTTAAPGSSTLVRTPSAYAPSVAERATFLPIQASRSWPSTPPVRKPGTPSPPSAKHSAINHGPLAEPAAPIGYKSLAIGIATGPFEPAG
jgi:Phosphoenolpyruvate phosphomutase